MEIESKNTRDFYRVATWSTCIGFAAMGGLFGSLRDLATDFRVEFSFGTILGAAIGAFAGWLLWKIFRALATRDAAKNR
jgi:NhaP-type Na+/H+ or K+/H+ antiporter